MKGWTHKHIEEKGLKVVGARGSGDKRRPPVREKSNAALSHSPSSEKLFFRLLKEEGLPLPRREWEFHHERQWRIDYAFTAPDEMVALEVEGGVYTRGRHTRGSGFMKDVEKYNALALAGYRLIRCTPSTLATQATIDLIREALLTQ